MRPRHIRFAVPAGVVLAGVGVTALLQQLRYLRANQETIMAKFEGLDEDLDALKQAVADAAQRVEDAVGKLMDDTADQAQIDEARVEVNDAIQSLKSIAPVGEPMPPEPPTA